MTEIELAYIAGLVDGEGSVTLCRQHKTDQFRTPTLSLTNTDKGLVDLMKQAFGGSIRKQKAYKEHHLPAWVWSCVYNRALFACTVLLPYLRHASKITRARMFVYEYKNLTPRHGKYTEEMRKTKLEFEERFLAS